MAEQNEPKDASPKQPQESLPPSGEGDRIEQISQDNHGLIVGQVYGSVHFNNYASDAPVVLPELMGKLREVLGPSPYKGLESFERADAENFWGRQVEIDALYEKLRSLYVSSTSVRLLPIYGPSGSGKSSLAKAGVIPYLENHPLPGMKATQVIQFRPGTMPLSSLEAALVRAENDIDLSNRVSRELLAQPDENNQDVYNGLQRSVCFLSDIARSPLTILIDQFEEVYSLCKDAKERHIFINNLLVAASDPSRYVVVILTLRSDFLREVHQDRLANGTTLSELFSSQGFLVPAMSLASLREAIVKPAEQAGYRLEQAVVDLLVEQTRGREGALPLLQFALQCIWNGITEEIDPVITLREIGGVGGALADKAQEIYDRLTEAEQETARRVFIGLVQLGEGTRDTRRRVAVNTLIAQCDTPERVQQVIRQFSSSEARLISLSSEEGDEIAEVTHESLFDHWQLLNSWLDSSREDIRFHRRLEVAANYWKEQSYPEGSLWRRPDLDLLKSYHRRASQAMTPLQIRFFKSSFQSARRRKVFVGIGMGTLAVLSGATSLLAFTAQQAKREVLASQLATQSEWIGSQSDGLYTTSALLAVEASETFDKDFSVPLEVAQALRSGLKFLPSFINQFNHEDQVYTASFSPSGQTVVTASNDGTSRLWNVETGKQIATFNHEGKVNAASFSPDGQIVVTASDDNTARLWNAETGRQMATLNHEGKANAASFILSRKGKVNTASFSPDGQIVVTSSSDAARLWNVETGEQIATLSHESWVGAASFSPGGQMIVTVSSDTARLWNVETGEQIATLNHEDHVYSASFSSDGQMVVTVSRNDTARLWNVETGEQIATLNHRDQVNTVRVYLDHEGKVNAASFSPNGQMVVTASSDIARLWNVETGEQIATLNHEDHIYSASFSPGGQMVVTASIDDTARLWDAATGEQIATLNHEDHVYSASFSPDGQMVVTASIDGTARLWNANTSEQTSTLKHEGQVDAANFSPDGQTVVTTSSKAARLWDVATSAQIATLSHESRVNAASFSPDGQTVITASVDSTARLWDAATGAQIAIFNHEFIVGAVSFSSDGQTVVTISGEAARLWDIATGAQIAIFNHEDTVNAASFSPDGQIVVTASGDGTARLWDVATSAQIAILSHKSWVNAASFSPDGQIVVTASDGTARLWDAATGAQIAIFNHEDRVNAASFSPDGQIVVTASGDTARLWDAATGAQIAIFNHEDIVNAASFSPDGQTVVTTSSDSTARLWNVNTGGQMATLNHEGEVNAASFSPDGQTVVTASSDTTARLWNRSPLALVTEICERISRNLTAFEWNRYLKLELEQYELTCSNRPVHSSVLLKAKQYAKDHRIKKAIAIFRRVQALDPDIDLDPSASNEKEQDPTVLARKISQNASSEEKRIAAQSLAEEGKIKEAVLLYQEAQRLFPEIDLDPSTEVQDDNPEATAQKWQVHKNNSNSRD